MQKKKFWFVLEKLKFLVLGVCIENYWDSTHNYHFFHLVFLASRLHKAPPFTSKDQHI